MTEYYEEYIFIYIEYRERILLVLLEISYAELLHFHLQRLEVSYSFIQNRGCIHLITTGHNCPQCHQHFLHSLLPLLTVAAAAATAVRGRLLDA